VSNAPWMALAFDRPPAPEGLALAKFSLCF